MWYIVLSRETGKEELKKTHTDVHRKWLTDQHRAGRILFSGPTADHAYGIYILLAPNRNEAERAASQDPFHVHGVRTMEILEWNPIHAFRLDGPGLADVERMATGK
jgi:uncharacterized protein YciI